MGKKANDAMKFEINGFVPKGLKTANGRRPDSTAVEEPEEDDVAKAASKKKQTKKPRRVGRTSGTFRVVKRGHQGRRGRRF